MARFAASASICQALTSPSLLLTHLGLNHICAEILYLRSNKLTSVPVLTSCVNLKELHLGSNRIQGGLGCFSGNFESLEDDLRGFLVVRSVRAGRGEHRECPTVGPAGQQDHPAAR